MRLGGRLGEDSNQRNWAGILADKRICGQKRDAFHCSLGDEDAIEWIFMYARKRIDEQSVLAGDAQLGVQVIQ